MQTTKKRGRGLRKAFQEIQQLTGKKPVIIEDILEKYGVSNKQQVATAIRQMFLVASKKPYYAWNPKMQIPKDMNQFAMEVVAKYRNPDKTPTQNRRNYKPINNVEAFTGLQNLLNELKQLKSFTKINLHQKLRQSKIPYYALMGKPIKDDFLEKGPISGVYKWRDQNVPVPNAADYYKRIKDYVASLPSKANRKAASAPLVKEVKTARIAKTVHSNTLHDRISSLVKGVVMDNFTKGVAELKARAIAEAKIYGVTLTDADFGC